MANMTFRAVVALLAVSALVGCGAMPSGQLFNNNTAKPSPAQATGATQAPIAPQGATDAKPVAPQQVVGNFPTSKKPAQGKPWTTMHENGFTGDYKVAGKYLGLNSVQAKKYEAMHSAGTCQLMEVPNGVVLDRLTFTDKETGVHKAQYGAKVALVKPLSRMTEVCDLGGGTYAMRFHGCNNHAVVVGWKPGKATVAPAPAPAPATKAPSCPKKQIAISVWESKASEFACAKEAIKMELADKSPFGKGHVSRTCGPEFRGAYLQDNLQMVASPTKLTMSLVRGGKVIRTLYDDTPTAKEVRVEHPADFGPGDSIRITPESYDGLWSPRVRPLEGRFEETNHCVTLNSFVVKPSN